MIESAQVAQSARSAPISRPSSACETVADDPLVRLWEDAVREYQTKSGVDLSVEGVFPLDPKDDIEAYIKCQEELFQGFRNDGPRWLRAHLLPIATVFRALCEPLGDTFSSASI